MKDFFIKSRDEIVHIKGMTVETYNGELMIDSENEMIAIFKEWDYWYAENCETEEKKSKTSSKQKNKI